MITEIVTFSLPEDMTRDELMSKYRQTVERWRANPDLIRKHYFFDAENARGGGVYVWKDRQAVERWHDEAYRELIRTHYGSEPEIQCFDTMILVDNANDSVSEVDPE